MIAIHPLLTPCRAVRGRRRGRRGVDAGADRGPPRVPRLPAQRGDRGVHRRRSPRARGHVLLALRLSGGVRR